MGASGDESSDDEDELLFNVVPATNKARASNEDPKQWALRCVHGHQLSATDNCLQAFPMETHVCFSCRYAGSHVNPQIKANEATEPHKLRCLHILQQQPGRGADM